MKKVIVIGIDGATWKLLDQMVEKKLLPNIQFLLENGVHGELISTIPPVTGPAWVSFATGTNPGKHGCYDFLLPNKSLKKVIPITSKNIRDKTFYEILDDDHKKCILINLPCSYPPRIKEPVITCILTQGNEFIFPNTLIKEIPELKEYRITPDMKLREKEDITGYVNDIRKLEKNRFDCAKKLFEKDWDMFFLLFSGIDWIQHVMYDKLFSGKLPDDSEALSAFKEIDEYIGWFVKNAGENADIVFLSDHGFSVYKRIFFVNSWLKEEGYLKVGKSSTEKVSSTKIMDNLEKERKNRLTISIPFFISDFLKNMTWLYPIYIQAKRILPITINYKTAEPKMSETLAFSTNCISSNFGGIYINDKIRFSDGIVDRNDYENIRDEIIHKLEKLKDPKTGKNTIKKVFKREDIYHGPEFSNAPDLMVMLDDDYCFNSNVLVARVFEENITDMMNNHALEGIFMAYGPDIKRGIKIGDIGMFDLAPTILHMLETPVPENMDGQVITQIFDEKSKLTNRSIIYKNIGIQKEKLKKHIINLKEKGKF